MNQEEIQAKFGDDYAADERTFRMGIDIRLTSHFAERFQGLKVLETCTGAGFTTLSLARTARHVHTIEIDPIHQAQAIHNVEKAGLSPRVTFISGNVLDTGVLGRLPFLEAAFIDPDWAVTGPSHQFRFVNSNTKPPADILLQCIFELTRNVAIVLPPEIHTRELDHLPVHERETLYLDKSHELYCLYFGSLITRIGPTEFRVPGSDGQMARRPARRR